MKTKGLFLSVVFLCSIFVGQVVAQRQMYYQNRQECLVEDLTPEQKTSINAIRLQSNNKVKLYRADLEIKRAELQKLKLADEPSENQIHQKIDEMSVLNTQIRKENASKRIAVQNELTLEQRTVFGANMGNQSCNNLYGRKSPRYSNCNYENRKNYEGRGGRGRNR